jgi:hypothetical protein
MIRGLILMTNRLGGTLVRRLIRRLDLTRSLVGGLVARGLVARGLVGRGARRRKTTLRKRARQ